MTPGLSRKLAFRSLLRVGVFLAGVGISFFLMPFLVRRLGDQQYGLWTLLSAVIGYYGLLDLGLATAVTRYLAGSLEKNDRDECNRLFNTSLFLYLALASIAIVATVILAAVAPAVCRDLDEAPLFARLILILGVNTALSFPLKTFEGLLAARLRYDLLAALELLTLLARTALIVGTLAAGGGILALAWSTFLAEIPRALVYLLLARRSLPFLRFSVQCCRRDTARRIFSFSAVSVVIQISDYLRFNVDPFVITAFVSLIALTHYNIASMLVRYFVSLMIALLGVLQPLFSRQYDSGNHEAMKRTFFLATKISVCVSSFIGFGLIAWGQPFIRRWMGPDYLDAYPSLVALGLGYTFALWQIPSVSLLYGTSRHKFFAVANGVEGVANLVLSLILVRFCGMTGVALGTFIPMALVKLIVQPIYVCRVCDIPYGEYMRNLLQMVLFVVVALAGPVLLTLGFIASEYVILCFLGLASGGLYAAFLWFSGFSPGEKQVLRRALWKTA